ncbi:MAG: type I methionyl aminopeptidase [Magnetococcales bacterium]|nr:type I methionyl aminopeptidase [Magnetococcales bacterium]
MMIILKTPMEIERMRISCQLTARTLKMIEPHVKEGVTTEELNDICHQFIIAQGGIPAPLNYRGFPKSICTSVNQQVCHGIPGPRVLREGDIINVDVTTIVDGWHGDASKTFSIGKITPQAEKIVRIAKECLDVGIRAVRPMGRLGDIGAAVENHAHRNRCSVVHEYCGHGIGRAFHEEPAVLHYGRPGTGEILRPGMTFTVEPMINLGARAIKHLPDQWTVVTKDHSLSAQFEHTLVVTESGFDVLTDLDGEYEGAAAAY